MVHRTNNSSHSGHLEMTNKLECLYLVFSKLLYVVLESIRLVSMLTTVPFIEAAKFLNVTVVLLIQCIVNKLFYHYSLKSSK